VVGNGRNMSLSTRVCSVSTDVLGWSASKRPGHWRIPIMHLFISYRYAGYAAHELAHLVLHQDGRVKGRPAEDQAHRFASASLMPKADVLGTLPRVSHLQQLIAAKLRWRVSLAALNYRVHKLGIVTDWKNRDFCIEISVSGLQSK
jgi:hypothetical protein